MFIRRNPEYSGFLVNSVNISNIMNTPRRVPTAIRPNIYEHTANLCKQNLGCINNKIYHQRQSY